MFFVENIKECSNWSNKFDTSFLADIQGCTTPRNEPGNCIAIKQCQPFVNILQRRPVSAADGDYLRRSQCGFSGNEPKVCCPTSGSYNNQEDVTSRSSVDKGKNKCGQVHLP